MWNVEGMEMIYVEKEWETEGDRHEFFITRPSWMRTRTHKRKRIDKKWLKRYAFQLQPVTAHGLVLRMPDHKQLNGYVGVPKDHLHYGIHYGDLNVDIQVHGGLTFSDFGNGQEGFKQGYWYFGFDTGHFMDYVPGLEEKLAQFREEGLLEALPNSITLYREQHNIYRNMAYVTEECESMAKQLLLPYPVHLFGVDFDIDALRKDVNEQWLKHMQP